MSHTSSTPSIRIYDPPRGGFSLPHRRASYASPPGPMTIPNARQEVPPPLPPPRDIGEQLRDGRDEGFHWALQHDNGHNSKPLSLKPGSSLLGGFNGSPQSGHRGWTNVPRRDPRSIDLELNHDDDGDHHGHSGNGLSRPSLHNTRFASERSLGQKAVQSSLQSYDQHLLAKIGGPNTPTRTTAPPTLSASAEPVTRSHSSFSHHSQLKPLSVPEKSFSPLDSPRWPGSGPTSPRNSGFRSPGFEPAFDRPRFGSIASTAGTAEDSCKFSQHHRDSYDHSVFSDSDLHVEESGMRELTINDRSHDRSASVSEEQQIGSRAGVKRRASSPPSDAAREDRPTTGSGNDLYHRRSQQMLVNRNSPVSRFHGNQGSLSSASSLSQRGGSFASSYGLSTASSMSSYSGEQRLSPGALSPSAEAEIGPVPPYAASRSLNPSPRGSLSRPHHQREIEPPQSRKMSTDNVLHSPPNSVSGRLATGSGLICECCPKKPKRFETVEELRAHESEKQYSCAYCTNRFKNKNEAERHQNSLHLRRHSWSCAALEGVRAAFHPSPTNPTAADVCGYCGDEFPNPANWEARSDHLNHVHKFGECNQAKKFFRADHFRQHLKHSHAGTSGKWTNQLENACMKDEPPTKDQMGSIASIGSLSHHPGSTAPLAPKPGVIDEVGDES